MTLLNPVHFHNIVMEIFILLQRIMYVYYQLFYYIYIAKVRNYYLFELLNYNV